MSPRTAQFDKEISLNWNSITPRKLKFAEKNDTKFDSFLAKTTLDDLHKLFIVVSKYEAAPFKCWLFAISYISKRILKF